MCCPSFIQVTSQSNMTCKCPHHHHHHLHTILHHTTTTPQHTHTHPHARTHAQSNGYHLCEKTLFLFFIKGGGGWGRRKKLMCKCTERPSALWTFDPNSSHSHLISFTYKIHHLKFSIKAKSYCLSVLHCVVSSYLVSVTKSRGRESG